MKATAEIEKLGSDTNKNMIIRNLSRILDMRILDIDLENKTISFAFDNITVIEKVKRELGRIGYPLIRLVENETPKELSF
jgi:hypothetical protein